MAPGTSEARKVMSPGVLRRGPVRLDAQLGTDRAVGAAQDQDGPTGVAVDGGGEVVERRVVALDDRQVQRRRRRVDRIVEVGHDALDLLARCQLDAVQVDDGVAEQFAGAELEDERADEGFCARAVDGDDAERGEVDEVLAAVAFAERHEAGEPDERPVVGRRQASRAGQVPHPAVVAAPPRARSRSAVADPSAPPAPTGRTRR